RYADNLRRFSELLDLTPFLDRAVRQLSLGQRMRAEIVMSLLHDPKILFLDEPTIGLDVLQVMGGENDGDAALAVDLGEKAPNRILGDHIKTY
ncbi:ATP-binding cassette domain-containing protein, partial [Rhizobium ruizarguesonis]